MFGLTARRVSRPAAAAAQTRCLGVVRARLDDLAAHRGETEVLQYEGMKWTIGDVKRYADAFASGVGELAVAPGDAVASLLRADAPEQHCAQIAAAASGFVFVAVDPASGPDGVRAALAESGAKVVVHTGGESDVALLGEAVPEFVGHASRSALPFSSSATPDLKYFVSTGLDMQPASINYQHIMAYDGTKAPAAPVADDALLSVSYDAAGKTTKLTQKQALESNAFPALGAVLNAGHAAF